MVVDVGCAMWAIVAIDRLAFRRLSAIRQLARRISGLTRLTGVTVIGILAGFASLRDLQVVLWDDLVACEGAASKDFAGVTMTARHQYNTVLRWLKYTHQRIWPCCSLSSVTSHWSNAREQESQHMLQAWRVKQSLELPLRYSNDNSPFGIGILTMLAVTFALVSRHSA